MAICTRAVEQGLMLSDSGSILKINLKDLMVAEKQSQSLEEILQRIVLEAKER